MYRAGVMLCFFLACCAKPTQPVSKATVGSASVRPPTRTLPSPPLLPKRQLAFQVEQGGQLVPVVAHAVTLRRAPFTLVFSFRSEGRVDLFVNAFFGNSTLELARTHRPYRELTGFLHASRIGEPPNNALRDLYVSELGPSQWITDPAHPPPYGSFDTACARTHQGQVCRHTVEQLMEIRQNEVWRPLSQVEEPKLYLVFFLAGPWTEGDLEDGDRPERDRDWLTIEFQP